MYVDVSKKHIIPGIEMLGRLSARENSKRDIPAKNEMIRTYTMGALSEIRKIADKVRALLIVFVTRLEIQYVIERSSLSVRRSS